MKPLIWVFAAIFAVVINVQNAHAESFDLQLPIQCGNAKNLLENLQKEYGEEVIFFSPSTNNENETLYHSLLINKEKQTWTFIVVNKNKNVSCVIASGKEFKLIVLDQIGI